MAVIWLHQPASWSSRAVPRRVESFATTTTITHDYDRIVLDEERLTPVMAVSLQLRGTVHEVLYAAVRNAQAIGDRAPSWRRSWPPSW
jgi:hypothetical protein